MKIPVLVIRGSDSDTFAPETKYKVRSTNPRASMMEIAGNHDLAGDNPQGLSQAVNEFLADARLQRAAIPGSDKIRRAGQFRPRRDLSRPQPASRAGWPTRN